MRLYPLEFIDSRWFEEFELKINNILEASETKLEKEYVESDIEIRDEIKQLEREIEFRFDVEGKNINDELDVLEVKQNILDSKIIEQMTEIDILKYRIENLDRAFHSYMDDQKKLQNLTLWEKIKWWYKREFSGKR